jgi:hypothetical protein
VKTDTYLGWLIAWIVAIIPMSTLGYSSFGALGIVVGFKFCVLMMLLGRFFWRKSKHHKALGET